MISARFVTLVWMRDRLAGTLTPEQQGPVDTELGRLEAAAGGRRTAVVADHAARLIGLLREIPRLEGS
jgi:hypothetical protein